MITRFILTICAVFMLFSAVSAQTPLVSECNLDQPTLYIGGSFGTIDHWVNGDCFPIQEYGVFQPGQTGSQWKFESILTIPLGATIKNALIGFDYSNKELDLFYGKNSQWVQHQWTFTLGTTINLGN